MLEKTIAGIAGACCRSPWLTLLVASAVTLGAIAYTYAHFAINTDTGALISSSLPWRQRELQLDAAFPQRAATILVVVDAATPETSEAATQALAAALNATPDHIEAVYRPDGGGFFVQNGLLFLSVEEVQHTTEQLIRAQPFLGTLAADPTLRGLANALAFIPRGVKEGQIEAKDFATPLSRASAAIEDLLQERSAAFSWSELMTGAAPTADELRRFIRVKPVLDFGALEPGAAASETIRSTAVKLGLTPDRGIKVRLTGPVAIADEEFSSLAEGALLNTLLTTVVVLLVLWLALRSGRIILAVLVSLFAGLALTAATGLALVGSFNPISVAFAVLFVGIGVDFGIQFSVRYRRERHRNNDLKAALAAGAAGIAKALALAAAATAAGFYAFVPTDYRGIAELGLIAGTGMIVAFITSITLLPGLLTLLRPPQEPGEIGYRWLVPVDRFMARNRILILVLTGICVVAGLPLLNDLKFEFNPLSLRSAKVESVATLLELMKDSANALNGAEVLAPSLKDAEAIAQRLERLSEISRATTLASFVPEQQDEKLAMIEDAANLLGPSLDVSDARPAPTEEETKQALSDAAQAFAEATGQQPNSTFSGVAAALTKLAGTVPARRAAVERTLLDGLKIRLGQIRCALRPERVSIDGMPPDLRREWVASDGRARVEIAPKGNQNNDETMRRFASAVLAAAPEATGLPILVQQSARTVVHAFLQAGAFALVSITLILFLALRRASDVLVTLVPLLFAGVVTLELTVLLGLPLNFANIIALPLLLGVGVAFKIYYVLAWRGGETSPLASSLTRAVVFSAMTTATAFASLWLSNHPGTSSMGKLLCLSLVTTLAAAVLFQPILMGPPPQSKPPS
jgi:hopanoid biosynthesis associated RND transporter like protein HpnN